LKIKNKPSYLWSIDFWQGHQDNSVGKGYSFQQMVLGQLDIHMWKNESGLLPHTTQQINSKWIKDLNVKAKTIKLLEENTGVNLCDSGTCNDMQSTSNEIKKDKHLFDFISCLLIDSITIKFKTLVSQKTSSRKWKDNPQDGRDYLEVICYLYRIYKEFLKSNNRKATQSLKWANNRNRPCSKEDRQMDK